jgi:hypothetical protein
MPDSDSTIDKNNLTYPVPLHLRRIYTIQGWLQKNEKLIEATDAVQLTIHVKKQANGNDNVEGTILHLVKSK